VIVWIDDVHWADASTTDLIGYLARRLETARVLTIVTARPSELAQSRHAFLPLKLDLLARGLCREIVPAMLDARAIERYLALQFPEHAFPAAFAGMIDQRTDGNPLFMADLLRDLRRRQVVRLQDGRWRVAEDLSILARELPESVRSLIQRKIDALEDTDRRLLAAVAVQGFDFDSSALSAALELDEELVETRLDRLEREHALVRFVKEAESADRSLTLQYRFAHHVYHNAFYDALRVTRRVALSRVIAETLVRRSGGQPGEGSAAIAILFETARDAIRAAEYWNFAAQASARLYAHDETATLAQRGLALLAAEPDGPDRVAAELALQMTYGLAIKTSQGYAVHEVGVAYARARELARRVSDPGRVIPVLIGLSAHHIVSGETRTAYEIGLEMLSLFERLGDRNLKMIAEWSVGAALFHLGELEPAHEHLLRGIDLHDPSFHGARVWQTGIEPGIFCRCELSRTLTIRGYPEQGLAAAREAVRQARALDHPQPLVFAMLFEIIALMAQRTPRPVLTVFDELAAVCKAHGFAQELPVGNTSSRPRPHRTGRDRARHRRDGRGAGRAHHHALCAPAAVLFRAAGRWADPAPSLRRGPWCAGAIGVRRGFNRAASLRIGTRKAAGHALRAARRTRCRGGSLVPAGARHCANPEGPLVRASGRPRVRGFPRQPRTPGRSPRRAGASARLVQRRPFDDRLRVRGDAAEEHRCWIESGSGIGIRDTRDQGIREIRDPEFGIRP
jgi:hypothetical protein